MTTASPSLNRELLVASWRSWSAYDGVRVGPWWLQWVWTLLFAAFLALPFTVIGFVAYARRTEDWINWSNWASWYGKNLIVTLTVAVAIHLLFDLLLQGLGIGRKVGHWKMWQRSLFFSGVPLVGLALAWPLGVTLAGGEMLSWWRQDGNASAVMAAVSVSLLVSYVMHHIFSAKAKQLHAEKQAAEAQLRLLQAQIEPHFLFNTLANVLTLIDADAPRAKHMLEAFIDYLRGSLTHLRRDHSSLDHELGMAQAYLGLMQMRMDARLSYAIDVTDAALRRASLPPLVLQPLVENAIQHGLESSVEGGHVGIVAKMEGGDLVLQVEDNGRGLHAPPQRGRAHAGTGLALDNLRARLLSRYGSAAGLTLEARQPQGTRATIRLPLSSSPDNP